MKLTEQLALGSGLLWVAAADQIPPRLKGQWGLVILATLGF